MIGPSRLASVSAPCGEIAPTAMTRMAAGTATTASAHPHGRITAKASTSASIATETASAATPLSTPSSRSPPCYPGTSAVPGRPAAVSPARPVPAPWPPRPASARPGVASPRPTLAASVLRRP